MKIAVLYVGASLPGPLRQAEQDIQSRNKLDLTISAHNCGGDLTESEFLSLDGDLATADIVFIIHVTNQENAGRIIQSLERHRTGHLAVIAINCMPDLMRRTRLGNLDFAKMMKARTGVAGAEAAGLHSPVTGEESAETPDSLLRRAAAWMADSIRGGRKSKTRSGPPAIANYTGLITRLPSVLKFLPTAGKLTDIKHYLFLFCYFLQPTPDNIRSMLLYAIKHYVPGYKRLRVAPPESLPAVGIYHPDAPDLFATFGDYRKWYEKNRKLTLTSGHTVGLLLMRPQIISKTRRHYDCLIRAIEREGLAVIPAISTFMDNRDACRQFFVDADQTNGGRKRRSEPPKGRDQSTLVEAAGLPAASVKARVSQIVSLTGFSFVGGPAMNDSEAAVEFLKELKVPFRSMVSLDIQTIESWQASRIGLNPIQTAMQIAIPEIDGATEPFIYGGMPRAGFEPEPIEDRCGRIARRLANWNRLQTAPRADLRIAFIIYCFPPNKGNIGTAAEMDVFPSLIGILRRLKNDGYSVTVPEDAGALRELLIGGEGVGSDMVSRMAYRMSVDEYVRLCSYVEEVEQEWGPAPGRINSNGRELLIPGVELGRTFIGIQPTFGYEGDPMRLLAAEGGAPHHGFMALYTYLEKVYKADAVVHVGTHGALEFMPGKQAGLSGRCWPDRLIGELPNIYIYSMNNPSEGTIAKRRSYAELISYLTPPVENAGLYKGLASIKETLLAYRQSADESERRQLFKVIEEQSKALNL